MTNPLTRRISFFDATLRDGEQAPGNTMTPEQKVGLALCSEGLGVDVIECGFPASSPADARGATLIAGVLTRARYATFNRTLRSDVDASIAAAGTGDRHQLQICGTGSDIHLEHKLGITRADAVAAARDVVRYAIARGAADVSFGVEDASRGHWDHIAPLVEAAVTAGARTVVLADTTGCATPQEFGALCADVRGLIGPHVGLATHCHDDLGLAVANSLAGVQAGADQVQATLTGIGERAGNAALEEVAAVLAMKGDVLGATTDLHIAGLHAAAAELERVLGREVATNKAIVGRNAFSTEAGIHQAGILRNPDTYEFLPPARFGRERTLVVGRHSGRAVLRYELGPDCDERRVDELYAEVVAGGPPRALVHEVADSAA